MGEDLHLYCFTSALVLIVCSYKDITARKSTKNHLEDDKVYQQETLVLVTEEEELPEHLDCSLEQVMRQMELIAVLDGFDEDLAKLALDSVDVDAGGSFPVILPGTMH